MDELTIEFGSESSHDEKRRTFKSTLDDLLCEDVGSVFWNEVSVSWPHKFGELLFKLAYEIGNVKGWPSEYLEIFYPFFDSHFHHYAKLPEVGSATTADEGLIGNRKLFQVVQSFERPQYTSFWDDLDAASECLYAFVFLFGISDGRFDHKCLNLLTQLCQQLEMWPELDEKQIYAKHLVYFIKVQKRFAENTKGSYIPGDVPKMQHDTEIIDGMSELDSLIGLSPVKEDVRQITNLLRVNQMRKLRNLAILKPTMHMVFLGNPGTGKTTIARLIAKIYKNLGVLSKGHLIEVDRSGLVAGYVGHTALKVNEVIQSALGGVLFIDEAYALSVEGSDNDFGKEAINSLIKLMEDHREDLVVIVAGYTAPMKSFMEVNPGLKSRFNKVLEFPDYSPDELFAIFKLMLASGEYEPSESALEKVKEVLTHAWNIRDGSFGNARFVRNLYESVVARQASRIVNLFHARYDELTHIDVADIGIP